MTENTEKKKFNINLPNTSFPMKASLSLREPERLKLWEKEGVETDFFENSKKNAEKFILHDGPPYANGKIHIGHALNKILKDMIVRFNAYNGKRVEYVPGWDCHGLPIEHALFKELGLTKDEVDQVKFRGKARKYAEKWIKTQKEDFKRLGIFADWENPYLTMNFNYQASIAKSFYDLYDKGYIYRGEKPVYWSVGCETALAEAELEYQDKTSKAIFVTFPIVNNEAIQTLFNENQLAKLPASVMIWTTTPWTLPANVGVAVHPDLKYGFYLVDGKELIVFAEVLEAKLRSKEVIHEVKCLKTVSGTELQKLINTYQHPFVEREGKVILADYVSGEDGTGLVHIAPGHGEDDYIYGHLKNDLPIVSPVNHKGEFTEDFHAELKLKGMNVFKGNDPIIEFLKKKGYLKQVEDHHHSYPFCWRSKTPVIVRSTPQWFLKVDHEDLRKRTLETINNEQKTDWYPAWGKNRITSMMENRPDWCLSRQRLWGVPIPVAYYKDTGEVYLTEKFKENTVNIFKEAGADAWFYKKKEEFIGDAATAENLIFETDILDVWFDSGVSHQAVLEDNHELGFPCELYLEGSDQHRGWFQTSLITSVALRDSAPFKQVLTHGFVVDAQGKKMSKSAGNVVSPQEVFEKYGADILRLWVSSCDTDHDIRMSSEILQRMVEAYRKIRNTFRYILGNINGFDSKEQIPFEELESIDRWVLSRLKEVSDEVMKNYESYTFHRIYQVIYDFCIIDLSSFYLDAQKDRLYCDSADSKKRKSAQTAFYLVAKGLAQLLAPILVFTTEEVWQSFDFGKEKSIHHAEWDKELFSNFDEKALLNWNNIRNIRRQSDLLIEKMREAKEVGSSLDCSVAITSEDTDTLNYLKESKAQLELGLIVSGVTFEPLESEYNQAFSLECHDQTYPLKVAVYKAKGEKCARCWKYVENPQTLDEALLCSRCFEAEKMSS